MKLNKVSKEEYKKLMKTLFEIERDLWNERTELKNKNHTRKEMLYITKKCDTITALRNFLQTDIYSK